MDLEELNTARADTVADLVRACADVDRFVDAVVAARPYADVEALRRTAETAAAGFTADEVEAALADHPRIGERHGGTGASAAMSGTEQGGITTADEVAVRLAEGNRRYEERFGRVFLVRAAGRDAEEVLALLEQRLSHDPATELEVTAGQLAEIAVLRVVGLVEPRPGATR